MSDFFKDLKRRPTIALDFDGVLHDYKGWNGVEPTGNPVSGAQDFVRELCDRGYDVFVMTTRAGHPGGADAVRSWILKHGFPLMMVTHEKLPASLYVDDRGFRFNGDWNTIIQFLNANPKPGRWGEERHTQPTSVVPDP